MSNLKLNKKALMGAALLAKTPTVKADCDNVITIEGKSQRGIDRLTLEEAPSDNTTLCVPGGSVIPLPDTIAVAINPSETNVKMIFFVSHITASDEDRILFLAYSQKTSSSPQILTPNSVNKLQLHLIMLEVIGVYTIPAFGTEKQASIPISRGDPVSSIRWEFEINLNMTEILPMIDYDQNTIYMQAALMTRSDFDAGYFENMILSEMDTIQFVSNECPMTLGSRSVTSICTETGKTKTTDGNDDPGNDRPFIGICPTNTTKNDSENDGTDDFEGSGGK